MNVVFATKQTINYGGQDGPHHLHHAVPSPVGLVLPLRLVGCGACAEVSFADGTRRLARGRKGFEKASNHT